MAQSIAQLRGFRNLGNTCYMNSTLQAMLASDVLNTILLLCIKKNPKSIETLSPILLDYCQIILDLLPTGSPNVLMDVQKTKDQPYTPNSFKKQLDQENQWFRGFQQHDSNELLVYMINEFADEKRDRMMSRVVKNVCFGKYKQYISCTECNKISESYFNFLDVLLPIPSGENPTLEDCFRKFATFDKLENDNKWACPNCLKKVVAYKKMEIHEVPEVAFFTFNRFIGTSKNNQRIRIYPRIVLEKKRLKLIATINHYGGTGGGHYVAHVARADQWFRADDQTISPIKIDQILNDPSVYMVVYQTEC